MTNNGIEFTIEDIIKKYDSLRALDKDTLNAEIGHMNHELMGSYARLNGLLQLIELGNDRIEMNKHLMDKIKTYYTSTRDSLVDLSNIYTGEKEATKKEKKEYAQVIRDNAILVHTHKPLIDNIIRSDMLKEDETRTFLTMADGAIDEIVRKHNLNFSKKYNTKEHNLAEDLRAYIKKHNATSDIIIEPKIEAEFLGEFDYLNNVIVPLINNIADHAYDPQNDIKHRLEKGDVDKKCIITLKHEMEKHMVVMTVADNGFGIPEYMKDKMFNKGETSRKEKEGHGVGLHYTKELLKQKTEGEMHFVSEPGLGTIFYIEIPYKKEDTKIIYRQ